MLVYDMLEYAACFALLRLHSSFWVLWTKTTLISSDKCTSQMNFKPIIQLLPESDLSSLILYRTPLFADALLIC